MSQDWAKNAFNELVKTEYTDLFDGDDVDTIIANLKEYSDEALKELMSKIMRVGKEKHFSALTMDVDKLVEWIKEVIKENNLKAITFIWDEFTEYFRNNMRALTGFQKIFQIRTKTGKKLWGDLFSQSVILNSLRTWLSV